jgi:hypothetical protein
MRLYTGYWVSQCLYVAALLGIADLLESGPRLPADLARATGTHERSLYRLLRALASLGVFAEDAEGRFGLTPLADPLRSDAPHSVRSAAIVMGEEHYRTWGELLYSVRTGERAFDRVFGQPVFEYLASRPREATLFDEAMVAVHGPETAAMLDAYDLHGVGTLVDVGGGNGSVLIGALQRYPSMRGILFDRPDVVERARGNLEAAGLAGRCVTVGGSFFESVPGGGDAYLLRHIIHDWDDARSQTILQNCRRAMGPGRQLLIVETVIPPGNGPSFAKLLDLTMLVSPGGMERTEAEYRNLLSQAGFRLERVVPTRTEVGVIEAWPQ